MKSRKFKGSESVSNNSQEEKLVPHERFTVVSMGKVIVRQFAFDFIICCLPVIVYSLARQILSGTKGSMLTFSSILMVSSISILLVGLLAYCSVPDRYFGENQLKFRPNRWMPYWAIVIVERVCFGLVAGLGLSWAIYLTLAIKALAFVTFVLGGFFFERVQRVRNLTIQSLHLLLLATLALRG
jgi:hypothetical protein